jgi:hypothetical protein
MISAAGVVGDQGRALNKEAWVGKVTESWFIDYSLRLHNMSMDQTSFFTPPVIMDVIWFHQLIGYKG